MLAYPQATQTITGVGGGTMVGGPPRGVIHTTETKPSAFYTAQTYYHIQVREWEDQVHWRQFIDLAIASRALFNGPDPVQTNRMGSACVNVAIVGYAKDSPNLSDRLLDELAAFVVWCEERLDIPTVFPLPFGGGESYGAGGVGRLTVTQWKAVTGWVGHQDVPDGNTHWDPGRLPTAKLEAHIATLKGEEQMTPTQARVEVATAWYAKAGVWMDGVTGEDPQARLTRLAKEHLGGRSLADIVQFVGRVSTPAPGEAVPAWVLDPTSHYSAPIHGGSGTVDTVARSAITNLRNHLRKS